MFGTAPRELARAITLQQTVELVRITIDVVEEHVDELAAARRGAQLREAVLLYCARDRLRRRAGLRAGRRGPRRLGRPPRGARGRRPAARRGRRGGALAGGRARLGPTRPVCVVVGSRPRRQPRRGGRGVQRAARHARLDAIVGVQGDRLVVALGGVDRPARRRASALLGEFGAGPVVVGPWSARPRRRAVVGRRGRSPACGPPPPGRTPPDRSWPTTCSPSARWTATRGPRPPGRGGLRPLAVAGRRPARDRVRRTSSEPARSRARRARCSCTPTPCATGCAGSPTSPASGPDRAAWAPSPCGSPGPGPAGGRRGPRLDGFVGNLQVACPRRFGRRSGHRGGHRSDTVEVVLVIVAPGQGAQTPGFLAPWLELARRRRPPDWLSAVRRLDLARYGTEADADDIRDTAVAQPLLVGRRPGRPARAVPAPRRRLRHGRRRRRALRRRDHRRRRRRA